MKEREIVINIENCEENMKQEDVLDGNECSFKVAMPMSVDSEKPVRNGKDGKSRKERRSTMSAKKPPRPPRGLSLDAADQKLIKEISDLLMIKRARIERLKALKKTRAAAKGMSSSPSSAGSFIAMLFTLVFCILIIFQGCHPWGNFTRNASDVGNSISPMSNEETRNLSVHMLSSNLLVPASNNIGEGGRAIR
ncbi:uncharacterized protein LOC131021045 [Salvia miltiorrhiza]|uniref:uncharacterized protein LOC131021045 n=1 Tax=Salvia miltiorrhiza TaxID=226208 RepID=UPI0025AD64D6|nr:uncharacterized protein LOC131021045 [Salvia miltiorrhiza]